RVLIVEDDPDRRESLRVVLALEGYDVRVAADGPQGLRVDPEWRLDAALPDLGLPLLDGYEVARRLRASPGGGLLLIAVSGYRAPQDRERTRAAGFDAHLAKPADLDVLLRLLRGGRSA